MIQFCRIRRIEGNITDINSLRPFERGRLLFYRVLLMTQIEKRMRSKALSAQKRSKTPKKGYRVSHGTKKLAEMDSLLACPACSLFLN